MIQLPLLFLLSFVLKRRGAEKAIFVVWPMRFIFHHIYFAPKKQRLVKISQTKYTQASDHLNTFVHWINIFCLRFAESSENGSAAACIVRFFFFFATRQSLLTIGQVILILRGCDSVCGLNRKGFFDCNYCSLMPIINWILSFSMIECLCFGQTVKICLLCKMERKRETRYAT